MLNKYIKYSVLVGALLAPHAVAGGLNVPMNETSIVQLPGAASGVIIGNPNIADVIVHDSRTLLVTGKSYGSTNLIVLGASGQKILSKSVSVSGSSSNQLTLSRGSNTETYICAPDCRATLTMGDSPEFFSPLDEQRKSLAKVESE